MIDEMKRSRGEMQQMAGEVRDKEERAKLLQDELDKMEEERRQSNVPLVACNV